MDHARKRTYVVFDIVRRQRVQMSTRVGCPPTRMVALRTFALKVRLVLWARSNQPCDTLLRMLRPMTVPLPQTSQRVATEFPFARRARCRHVTAVGGGGCVR